MIISRLQIHGFKSFADKVSLDFQKGITAVVGPNGCGKSNIVDAIRWVMGEQSAKTLRGKNMEDTIFGGSDGRKPLGMTEVSVFFSTEDGRIPAKYLNFSEIQVTRRLFRDGESEYLLNGAHCRLLDIAELFMDTGAGAKAYSIIEQGKIGMILSSKPEERRFIIEEAAGVTKFKARKQVALKKIDTTRQNLLRIGDIVSEIRRQMNSLQRQAKKAEKFREYREELKEIELLFAVRGYLDLAEEKKAVEAGLARLRDRAADNALQTQSGSLALEERKSVLLEEEKRLNEAQEENYRVRGELAACDNRLGFQRKELANLEERAARFSQERDSVCGRVKEAEDELRKLEEQGEALLASIAREDEGLAAAEETLAKLTEEEKVVARRLEERRRELFGMLSEISQFNNQHAAAARRLESVREQLERNRREGMGLHERLSVSTARASELEVAHNALAERKGELEGELAALRVREAELRKSLEAVEHSFHAERDRLSKKSSRLHSLQELEAQFAGYGRGVRSLCLAEPFKGRLNGVVADILEIAEDYEVALEAALAERLQYVICNGEADAREAVSFLRQNSGGRCSLIPRELRPAGNWQTPKGAERLLDRITVSEENRGMAEALLGQTFLAETPDIALSLGGTFPHLTFVTKDGDMVTGGGILHGGSMEAAQQGLIHKKRQIKELSAEVETLTTRVTELESERARLREEGRAADESLKTLRQELHQTEILLVNSDKDLQRVREESQRIGERLAVKALEDEQFGEERDSLEREMEHAARERSTREAGKGTAEQELKDLQDSLGDKQREIADARETVTALKVGSAALREKRESGQRTMKRVEESIREFQGRHAGLEIELKNSVQERVVIKAAIVSGEMELKSLLQRQEQLEESCVAIRSGYEAEAGLVRGREAALKELKGIGDELSQALGERNLRLAEIVMRLGNLEETVADKYRVAVSDLVPRYADLDIDENERRGRQAELAGLIEGIGEVNLTAIEEFRELEERFDFLSAQKADLEESLHGLQQAIQRINRTTRKRFLDTFNLVNEKFQEVFPRLFCGGRAELKLSNEEDLLETGIDIIIQPPGKKLQNVNLLSGGEKALTAVALMFAIFLIKPAPFCLLDEVDAPLDEANIGRFNEMVREMSSFSQFIIITHNKATMTNADSLYGVTMEEPGVSKLVSVKLQ
ncbi:MAG: chromosome segregation protein SMC [Deltaproteobacteria bacterium]|nr:chromosome segregation protein SMC [Deltaproteobacteria bacterium]